MYNSTYITLSRHTGLERHMQLVANNVANSNTHGFKADKMLFEEYLIDAGKEKLQFTNDRLTYMDFVPGTITQTGADFDLAIVGQGFFGIQTAQGERYTRNGNFIISGTGELMTANGDSVLNRDGGKIVFTSDDRKVEFRSDGKIVVDGDERGSLKVVGFVDENQLINTGNNLFDAGDATENTELAFNVIQGALENSNVNAVKELTQMIEVQRGFTGTANLMSSIDDLSRAMLHSLGKVE